LYNKYWKMSGTRSCRISYGGGAKQHCMDDISPLLMRG